jgi:hypothetical protein
LIIAKTAAPKLICTILTALGGVLGAYLGGKYVVRFALFGVRGYEAVGLVGAGDGLPGGITLSGKWF